MKRVTGISRARGTILEGRSREGVGATGSDRIAAKMRLTARAAPTTRRVHLAVVPVPLVVAMLSGCGLPLVPVEPNRQPLWMTIQGGVAEFLWCGQPTEQYDYLLVEYLVYLDPTLEGQLAEGSGPYSLGTGERFSTVTPPGDVVYSVTASLPSSRDSARVFVFGGRAQNDVTWNATFEPGTLEDFADDLWLSPQGDRESKPCSEADANDETASSLEGTSQVNHRPSTTSLDSLATE